MERIDEEKRNSDNVMTQIGSGSSSKNTNNEMTNSPKSNNEHQSSQSQSHSMGISMRVTERNDEAEEVIVFSGPTPGEAEAQRNSVSPKSKL